MTPNLALDVGESTGWAFGDGLIGTYKTEKRKSTQILTDTVDFVVNLIQTFHVENLILEHYTFGKGFQNYLQVESTGAIKTEALKRGCKLYAINYSTCKKFCIENYRVEPKPSSMRFLMDFKTQHELDAWLVLKVFLSLTEEEKEQHLC